MIPQWFVVLAYILAGGAVVGALLYVALIVTNAIMDETHE